MEALELTVIPIEFEPLATVSGTPLDGAAIDQLPVEFIEPRKVEFDASATVFAADKYIPFVGTEDPLGTNAVAVLVLDNVELVPE